VFSRQLRREPSCMSRTVVSRYSVRGSAAPSAFTVGTSVREHPARMAAASRPGTASAPALPRKSRRQASAALRKAGRRARGKTRGGRPRAAPAESVGTFLDTVCIRPKGTIMSMRKPADPAEKPHSARGWAPAGEGPHAAEPPPRLLFAGVACYLRNPLKKPTKDLTQGPVLGHLLSMALPMMIGMTAHMFQNIYDGVLAGRLGIHESMAVLNYGF